MASRQEEIRQLLAGGTLPAHRIVQLRTMGMHAIRYEFVVRLLRADLKIDTLSIYWDRGTEFMLKRELEDARRRLVLGRRKRVSCEFPDRWLLCYPDDADTKQRVEATIDEMVEKIREQSALGEIA